MLATFPLFAVAAALLILGYAWWSQPPRRARRALRGKAQAAIAAIRHGDWVKVTGVVTPLLPLLTSPIREEACVGFRLDVERVDGSAPVTFRREACGAFAIVDDTGVLRVEGPFLLGLAAEGDWSTMRPRLLELLEAAGAPHLGLSSYRGFAFREALLKPGARVTVFGLTFLEPDPTAHAVRSSPLVLRMRGSAGQPVVVAAADEALTR
jgi:hypothetical protein